MLMRSLGASMTQASRSWNRPVFTSACARAISATTTAAKRVSSISLVNQHGLGLAAALYHLAAHRKRSPVAREPPAVHLRVGERPADQRVNQHRRALPFPHAAPGAVSDLAACLPP